MNITKAFQKELKDLIYLLESSLNIAILSPPL